MPGQVGSPGGGGRERGRGRGRGATAGYSLFARVLIIISVFVNRYMLRFVTSHRAAAMVSFRVPRRNTELHEEKQKSNFLFNLFCLPHYLCDYKSKISTNSREHYNPINQ